MAAPPGAQRERGEVLHNVLSGRSLRVETVDGRLLRLTTAFTINDQCVVDLPAVDHVGRELHSAHEPQARVRQIEVHARR